MESERSTTDSDIETDECPSMLVRGNIGSLQDHHYTKHTPEVVEISELRITSSSEPTPPRFEIHSSTINENERSRTIQKEIGEASSEETQQNIYETKDIPTDEEGDTPVHMAIICYYTQSLIIQLWNLLLDIYPKLDILDHQNILGQTPLHLAVLTKCHSTVQLLLDLEANTTMQDNKLRTPSHIACAQGDLTSLTLLCHSQVDSSSVWIGLYDGNGQTCLHIAVRNSNIKLVQILLKHGADINARDRKSGRTAFHFAVEAGDLVMIRFLLSYSALRVDLPTFAGQSPAQLAYGRRRTDVIELLARSGIVDVSSTPSDNDDDSDKDND